MKITIVSAFYSKGMGYAENCLPKALAALGHEVHVVTSNLNVYGNTPDYERTYAAFLGPADQGTGTFEIDGYTVHRLRSGLLAGYVSIKGLVSCLSRLRPDVVHCMEIASLQAFQVAAAKPFLGFKFFAETHQHLSVMKPYMRQPNGQWLRRVGYRLTRTLPTYLASLPLERCYAIAPDCVEVVTRFYGVPEKKTRLQSLGTDTDLFRPALSPSDLEWRAQMRARHGYRPDDILCVYTGRFSSDKNPLLLARAVDALATEDPRFHALFVGEGAQKAVIQCCRNATVVPFMLHAHLADIYRMADIAVWPRQESMSMLDAASAGLPLVVADTIGESERVAGNGSVYRENDVDDLRRVLAGLASEPRRRKFSAHGREKMLRSFSWVSIARSIAADYEAAGAVARA